MTILFFSSFSLFAQEKPSVAAEIDFICGAKPYSTSLNSPLHSGSGDSNCLNTFEIKKQPRGIFLADAGDDQEVDRNESITLQARGINENALYNWYDFNGDLIYTGTDLTVSPDITQQYKLEIISDLDGLKDYDAVAVTVNPYRIISMAPNPVSSQLTVHYMAEGANSGYIMVVDQSTGASNNYIIDPSLGETTIDLTGQPTGLYTLVLVCNGKVQDTQSLAKQ